MLMFQRVDFDYYLLVGSEEVRFDLSLEVKIDWQESL